MPLSASTSSSITSMIMIILLVTDDFLTMSLTTDHVEPRREP
ncbi:MULTISPECIES: hypothetical protein [Burkholderia cepacia complex]|nr:MULTISPECIES: hypothetical protein [Burkholderia cepacia complex]MDI9700411.1 hypothetical protein [Burkholderia cenocepacia]MDN7630739.1 hypothetical protein [Burkholderia cenocepacia]